MTVLGWLALAVRAIDLAAANVEVLFPTRAYGLWITAIALVILSRAVYEMRTEQRT